MKFVAACLAFLFAGGPCFGQDARKLPAAQSRADFTGTWVQKDARKNSSWEVTLAITHHEPEIRITRNFKEKGRERIDEVVYYSDGRGETNPTSLRSFPNKTHDEKVKSETSWIGNKLVIKYTVRWNVSSDILYVDVVEMWELAPDRNTLIHTVENRKISSALHKRIVTTGVMEPSKAFYRRVSTSGIK